MDDLTPPVPATPTAPAAPVAPVAAAPAPASAVGTPAVAAPVVSPVATGVAPAPVAPAPAAQAPSGLFDADGTVVVPAGTQAKIQDLIKNGKASEQTAFIDSFHESQRDAIKSIFTRQGDFKFREGDAAPVDPNAPPEPLAFVPLSEEEYLKADPRLQSYHDAFVALQEEARQPSPEFNQLKAEVGELLRDPVVKTRLDARINGREDIPPTPFAFNTIFPSQETSPDAPVTMESLFAAIEKTKNDPTQLAQTVHNAVMFAVNAAAAKTYNDGIAEGTRRYEQIAEQQIETQRLTDYWTNTLDKIGTEIPALKSDSPFFARNSNGEMVRNQEGKLVPTPGHPALPFASWLQSQVSSGALTDSAIQKFGIDKLFMVFQANQAGGTSKFIAQQAQSLREVQAQNYRGKRLAGLSQMLSSTIGSSVPSGSNSGNSVHGVDLAKALTDRSYANASMRSLDASQLAEVSAAMRDFVANSNNL